MAKPRGGKLLPGDLAAVRTHGVDVLICALPLPEMRELDLVAEPEVARAAGLEFVHLPVQDFGTPDLRVIPVLAELAGRYRRGANLAVHCRGGIGRSSVLAAAILVLSDLDSASAWRLIGAARGRTVPETDQQREWVYQLWSGANQR